MTKQNQEAIEDLRDWSVITGRPLPYPAEEIVGMEARGFVVDLVDGSVSWEIPGERIEATAAGAVLVGEVQP